MNGIGTAFALVAIVGLLAWFLRRVSAGRSASDLAAAGAVLAELEELNEEPETGPYEELAITSEGDVFIPDGRSVRVLSVVGPGSSEEHREDIESGLLALSPEERRQLQAIRGKPGQALQAGDLTGARICRGAAGVVPWVLETLGRDGDYGFFPFETQDGAQAALALIERYGVVRRPRDEEGRLVPPSPEDFEEARRRYDESKRAIDIENEPGQGWDPGTYSDRR